MDYLSLHFAETESATEHFSVSMNFPKLELTDMDRTLESLVGTIFFVHCVISWLIIVCCLLLLSSVTRRASIRVVCCTCRIWTLNTVA